MSSGSQKSRTRSDLLARLARELRQFTGLGASFFRAAAARAGMPVTDMQVIDILDSGGPMTAGQLAELTGLTTGAITGMLKRLEEAGIVRRESDPNDGRRVIVRLESDKDALREVNAIFASSERVWEEIAAQYDDEQIAFLLGFLERGNALSQREIIRLREAPAGEAERLTAPLGDLTSGRLVATGVAQFTVRGDDAIDGLYQASFEGPAPEVKVADGAVTIRYPRRLTWLPVSIQRAAEVALNTAIPWEIVLQGGGSGIVAELGKLELAGLEVKGGFSNMRVELPAPSDVIPVRMSGAASDITVRRPAGAATRVHLKGWVSHFIFDDQTFSNLGSDARLQSPGYDTAAERYDIEVSSSASMVAITTE